MQKVIVWLCLALLTINVVYATVGVVRLGPRHIDAYGIWMLKAKAWVLEEGLPFGFLKKEQYGYSHGQYPVLLPFLMSRAWNLVGSEYGFLLFYPFAYIAVLWIIFTLLRQDNISSLKSLVWTTGASFLSPLIAQGGRGHAGLADIWIALLFGVCLWAVREKQVLIAVLSVMLASQIKTEGVFGAAILLGLTLPIKSKLFTIVIAILPAIFWQLMVRLWQLPSDFSLMIPSFGLLVERIGILMVYTIKEMMNINNWYVIWAIFWLSIFFGKEQRSWWNRKGWKILLVMVAGYAGIYLFSTIEITRYVSSSMDRIMLQLLPLWFVGIAGRSHIRH